MPKARPDLGRRLQRARRRNPIRRPAPRATEVTPLMTTAEEVVPVLAKLGMDATAAPIETGDKVWALASIATLLSDDAQHRQLLLSHQVIPRILYALKSDTNLEVRREASGALRNLCLCDDDTQSIFDEMDHYGIVDVVLNVLKWAALGLQSHERRLERAQAPLIQERERLMSKPLDQMNRKERRHMAKLAQGRLPSATAGATAEFGNDAHDALDMHAWGSDAPASLQAMDSAAAQCLVEMCENLVTIISCLCASSEKLGVQVLQWSWTSDSTGREGLAAWLCEALSLAIRACDAEHDAELAKLPECAAALVSLGLASAQALWVLTDPSLGYEDMPSAVSGTDNDRSRGLRRLDILVRASMCLATHAAPRPAMLGAAATGALMNVLAVVEVEALASFVRQDVPTRVTHLLAEANADALKEDARSALEACLDMVSDMARVLPKEEPLSMVSSPLVEALLRLATPSQESSQDSVTASARRGIETRALTALNQVLWHTALHAPPPPSEWPTDDEEALAEIHAWRAHTGSLYLEGGQPCSTPTYEALSHIWQRVFETAAFWAGLDSVANAAPEAPLPMSSVAGDGLAQVSTSIGCLWSTARLLEGQLPLVQDDAPAPPVTALTAAYLSAHDASVRVKVLGTLACLARSQFYCREPGSSTPPPAYAQVYLHLASFWADVAGHISDAETLAAFVHAIVDTYADEQAPWDAAYRDSHLHERLCTLVPQYMGVAKRVHRRTDPMLHKAVHESVDTLRAFLSYRQEL